MKPTKYAVAAAQAFVDNGFHLVTGWHLTTAAAVEPQKAIFDLRRMGVVVISKRLPTNIFSGVCYRYDVPEAYRAACRRIASSGYHYRVPMGQRARCRKLALDGGR